MTDGTSCVMRLSHFLRALAWHLAGHPKEWAIFPGFETRSDFLDGDDCYVADTLGFPEIGRDEQKSVFFWWDGKVSIYHKDTRVDIIEQQPVHVVITRYSQDQDEEDQKQVLFFDTFIQAFTTFFDPEPDARVLPGQSSKTNTTR